ncbi:uncharacterized protein EI90DRAFT_3042852, partial [Cantharellus anzutake]|uniref:uncharacterized protein n=1 Tax=Cantharellus anzutake TaxID=1750568 RepID=UPI001904F915
PSFIYFYGSKSRDQDASPFHLMRFYVISCQPIWIEKGINERERSILDTGPQNTGSLLRSHFRIPIFDLEDIITTIIVNKHLLRPLCFVEEVWEPNHCRHQQKICV